MRKFLISLSLLALVLWAPLHAAGTVVVESRGSEGVMTYTLAWTSTSGGAVNGNQFRTIHGRVSQIRIVPGTGGTQPSDNYDVTLIDPAGIDLLNASGVDQSNSVGEYFMMDPPIHVTTQNLLDLVITNAGSAKTGTVTVWVQR
jgi:hypothetical protein